MVWPHYVALLLVPLAIARPRVDTTWFLPYALWPILAIDDRVLRAWMFLLLALALMAVPLVSRSREHSGCGSFLLIVQGHLFLCLATSTCRSAIVARWLIPASAFLRSNGGSVCPAWARRFRGWTLLAILAVFSIAALFMPLVESFGQLGFDFRGTLWEPARAIIDGSSMYPEPTRAAMELGNPAVLALLPAGAAPWLWLLLLAGGCRLAMWVLRVRDWRCVRLSLARRFLAAAWAAGSAAVLVLEAWALVGFEGLRDSRACGAHTTAYPGRSSRLARPSDPGQPSSRRPCFPEWRARPCRFRLPRIVLG